MHLSVCIQQCVFERSVFKSVHLSVSIQVFKSGGRPPNPPFVIRVCVLKRSAFEYVH